MARVLLVDDEKDVLVMLTCLLESHGHDVHCCEDGNAAVDLLQKDDAFQLVITDFRMFPVNGLWLLSLLREEYPSLPVIMVTAYYTEEKAAEALRMGACAYLAKPFKMKELLDTVNQALGATESPDSRPGDS